MLFRSGTLAGIRTCLVESGCHSAALQPHFSGAVAEFVASSVVELLPRHQNVAVIDARASSFRQLRDSSLVEAPVRHESPERAGLPQHGGLPSMPMVRRASSRAASAQFALDSSRGLLPTTASCHPSQVSRSPSSSSSVGSNELRAWRLGRGNLVYSAGNSVAHGALITVLRNFFEERAAGADAIGAADAIEAMDALGVSPPRMADGRPLHQLPFDVTSRSRVTFAQLCREVQRVLELSDEGSESTTSPAPALFSRGRAGSTISDSLWPSNTPEGSGRGQAPFMRRMSGRLGGLATIASDTTLDTLESRWLEGEQQRQRDFAVVRTPYRGSSRTINALVDRRFLYLGKEEE